MQSSIKLSHDYIFKNCLSNYEFKSLIKSYLVRKVLFELIEKDFEKETEGFKDIDFAI